MTDSRLTPTARTRALARLAATTEPGTELDVLVIGGGITGAGIALDAVTRGLSTGIVEAQDWSAGTSSRSSKLVHGGLRYLQMLDFKLVREALTERDILIKRVAPHLVTPIPFLYPLRHRIWERAFIGAGIALYDTLASLGSGKRSVPWHRHLTRKQLDSVFPDFAPSAAIGAIEYWDARVDDSRLVVNIVRTAHTLGAHAASRTQVVELLKSDAGAVEGAVIMDLETGETFPVRAKAVISSTGIWTEDTQSLTGDAGGLRVLTSKGIHIVVPRERIAGDSGLILQTDKSVLFVIPWSRYWVIGTTDTPWTQDLVNPTPTSADIDYVLEKVNGVLVDPIDRSDIVGTWAGLRPLLQPGTKDGTNSAKVSREHTVASPVPGLTSIAGGKLTTYRVMAKDAVDFALGSAANSRPSVTKTVPLEGAVGLGAARDDIRALAHRFGWNSAMIDHLFHRYGANIREIVTLCEENPTLALPVASASAYLRAEIAYAVTHEGALHLEDILLRRTRIQYEYSDEGLESLDEVAAIVAPLLGWNAATVLEETASYRERAAAEQAASLQGDDAAAANARAQAHPIVAMAHEASQTATH